MRCYLCCVSPRCAYLVGICVLRWLGQCMSPGSRLNYGHSNALCHWASVWRQSYVLLLELLLASLSPTTSSLSTVGQTYYKRVVTRYACRACFVPFRWVPFLVLLFLVVCVACACCPELYVYVPSDAEAEISVRHLLKHYCCKTFIFIAQLNCTDARSASFCDRQSHASMQATRMRYERSAFASIICGTLVPQCDA